MLVVVPPEQLGELELREDLFDDLCLEPVNAEELAARLAHLFWRTGKGLRPDLIEHGPLVLNLETYQAAVAGKVLDLTYMEYELLRFLGARPGKVFTRETLLSRVWGYEYYGGARTVDVHVRRLRAKLGEEHATSSRRCGRSATASVRPAGYLERRNPRVSAPLEVGPDLDFDGAPRGSPATATIERAGRKSPKKAT